MSAISLRLPDSLHRRVKEVAARDNVSINQLITLAVAEKLSALDTQDYLEKLAARGSRAKFLKALKSIPDREPDPFDKP